MASQNVIVYLSPDGGEVEDILNLLAGKEMELEWVGTLNGSDVPIRVRIADVDDSEDENPGPASSLFGIDPNFTDGLSAVEYLRRNREGFPEGPDDAKVCIHGNTVWFGHECGECMGSEDGHVWAEQQTWTFVGHWNNDRIVVEYILPGDVEDDREDTGFWEQGLWAASGTGAIQEDVMAEVIAEYEAPLHPDEEVE